jgi:hypothetical protein
MSRTRTLIWSCLALVVAGPTSRGWEGRATTTGTFKERKAHGHAVALLRSGDIVVISAPDSRVQYARQHLTDVSFPTSVGHYLAVIEHGQRVVALLPGSDGHTSRLVILDLSTLKTQVIEVPPFQGGVSALAAGGRPLSVFVVGSDSGHLQIAARVLEHSGSDQEWRILGRWRGFPTPYQATFADEVNRLYVSYHGNGDGLDWFELRGERLEWCGRLRRHSPHNACIPAHGGFAVLPGGVIGATGSSTLRLSTYDGTLRRTIETHLVGNHLMELAVDQRRGRAYAVGPCGYAGGYSVTRFRTTGAGDAIVPGVQEQTETALVVHPGTGAVCADRIALGEDSQWIGIVAYRPSLLGPIPAGVVKILNAQDASVLSEERTDAPPVDIVAVP